MSIEIIGIDHIYIAVSDLNRSERFYDCMMTILGFQKNNFVNEGDKHIHYYNRHFGFVLRPLEWESVKSNSDAIDLKAGNSPSDYSIAYAWAEIELPEKTKGVLGLGSDDAVKVWLNG